MNNQAQICKSELRWIVIQIDCKRDQFYANNETPEADSRVLLQPLEKNVHAVYKNSNHQQNLTDHWSHFLDPLYGSVVFVDVPLDECICNDRLCATYVSPTSAETIAGNLRHGE